MSGFIQDDLANRIALLTLNPGLRYDLEMSATSPASRCPPTKQPAAPNRRGVRIRWATVTRSSRGGVTVQPPATAALLHQPRGTGRRGWINTVTLTPESPLMPRFPNTLPFGARGASTSRPSKP